MGFCLQKGGSMTARKSYFRGKKFHALGGEVWLNVHSEDACSGETCVIHNPTKHSMSTFPMHLRETGLVERTCEHHIGHPDPDSAAHMDRAYGHTPGTWLVHGCDGCCAGAYGTQD